MMYSAAITLFTALVIPLRLAAQNDQVHTNGNKNHHYQVIDMGRSDRFAPSKASTARPVLMAAMYRALI